MRMDVTCQRDVTLWDTNHTSTKLFKGFFFFKEEKARKYVYLLISLVFIYEVYF